MPSRPSKFRPRAVARPANRPILRDKFVLDLLLGRLLSASADHLAHLLAGLQFTGIKPDAVGGQYSSPNAPRSVPALAAPGRGDNPARASNAVLRITSGMIQVGDRKVWGHVHNHTLRGSDDVNRHF